MPEGFDADAFDQDDAFDSAAFDFEDFAGEGGDNNPSGVLVFGMMGLRG